MKKRSIIATVVVTIGLNLAFGVQTPQERSSVQNQARQDLTTYRNAKNEICQMVNAKQQCLSERAYQKEQVMKERRARSNRESLHDRVD
ncbi:MAG: hypothetical protein H7235_07460 [Bdellovibrionaceae bacterium]|nr:hypothetical protein [Pseudobdellovibrionaceae bacterium]